MDKTKISYKPKEYSKHIPVFKLKPGANVKEFNANEQLLDKTSLGEAIVECLENNDPEGVVEMIEGYLEALHINKQKTTKKHGLSRITMYKAFKHKNPTLKTLCKMMHCAKQEEQLKERLRKSIQQAKEGKFREISQEELDEWEKIANAR